MASGVRERSRDAFRTDLAKAAVDVLAERGFDGVTVDELAREVGISRATFFRYFGSKEDMIVVAVQASENSYADALRAYDDHGTASVWQLLHAAFEPAIDVVDRDPDRLRARLQMIRSVPSLRARLAEKRAKQLSRVVEALTERIGDEFSAQIFTVAAYTALDITWERWASDEQASFRAVLDDVFDRLARGNAVP